MARKNQKIEDLKNEIHFLEKEISNFEFKSSNQYKNIFKKNKIIFTDEELFGLKNHLKQRTQLENSLHEYLKIIEEKNKVMSKKNYKIDNENKELELKKISDELESEKKLNETLNNQLKDLYVKHRELEVENSKLQQFYQIESNKNEELQELLEQYEEESYLTEIDSKDNENILKSEFTIVDGDDSEKQLLEENFSYEPIKNDNESMIVKSKENNFPELFQFDIDDLNEETTEKENVESINKNKKNFSRELRERTIKNQKIADRENTNQSQNISTVDIQKNETQFTNNPIDSNKVDSQSETSTFIESRHSTNDEIKNSKFDPHKIKNWEQTCFLYMKKNNVDGISKIESISLINSAKKIVFEKSFFSESNPNVYTFDNYKNELSKILSEYKIVVGFNLEMDLKFLLLHQFVIDDIFLYDLKKSYEAIMNSHGSSLDCITCANALGKNYQYGNNSSDDYLQSLIFLYTELAQKASSQKVFYCSGLLPKYDALIEKWGIKK